MPAERLGQNVVNVPSLLKPAAGNSARFKGYRTSFPNILNSRADDLHRVKIQHVAPVGFAVRRVGPHVSPTIQPPAGSMCRAVGEGFLLVEVHQQGSALERLQPDINQGFLRGKCGHVIAPAFSPITNRRNIYGIKIRVAVVASPCLGNQLAPVLEIKGV